MDFTHTKYLQLLQAITEQGYTFQTFTEFLTQAQNKSVILRHDVDLKPFHSLAFARMQHERGIRGVYYFRAVSHSFNENVIRQIAKMGHEIGYHYENLTTCNGNLEEAIKDFETNLDRLRKIAPVSTICMHGSPLSKYDSKDLWKKYNYRDFGIIGEPYFDLDFSKTLYLTDTGRKWDGVKVSIRDKVNSGFDLSFHSTDDIIQALNSGQFPDSAMFTFHPQRWSASLNGWVNELMLQNVKNSIKYLVVKLRN